MAKLETDFNKSPYFDDYVDVAEGKDYHRVLFKPGLAVQTRELTQLQSMMQEQIARFGDNIFKEGTVVDGCSFQYDANVAFVRLRDRDPGGNTISVSVFANGIVQGLTSGVRAKVITTASGTEAATPDTNVLMVKYLNGGTSKTAKTFSLGETLSFLPADGGGGQQANTLNSAAFGFGSIFSVGEGIVFGKGHFVNVRPQSIILEKFSSAPSYKVGFKIVESTVNSDTDSTLLDNARGSYNYTAPGADRLKLTSTLTKKVLGTANTEAFTPIFEVDAGSIRTVKNRTVYDVLGDEMANRTYDESGNYEIKKMQVSVKEHYDTGSNLGKWASSNPIANTSRLAVGIEPGEAYVMGYHNEHLATVWIDTDKGIDTVEELGVDVSVSYSNYINATSVVGPWDVESQVTVDLYNGKHSAIDAGTYGTATPGGSKIGEAKLKFVEYFSGTPGSSSGNFRFYLYDINMTSGPFSDVRSIYRNNASGPDSLANIVTTTLANGAIEAVLTEPSFDRSVYKSGLLAVKQFTNNGGTVNATYTYRAKDTISFGTNGQATLTMPGSHAGGTDELGYSGSLNQTSRRTLQIVPTTDVKMAFDGTATFANTGNTITLSGGTFNFSNLNVGDFVEVSNTGSTSSLLKVANVDSTTAIQVNPSPLISDGGGATIRRVYPAGYIFDMGGVSTDGTSRSATASSTTQMDIDLQEPANFASGFNGTLIYNAQRESANPAQKLVRKSRYVKIDCSSHSAGTSGPWPLGFADVFNIRNVYLGTDYSTSNRNVTADFKLVPNSTDTLYKHSKIERRPNAVSNLTSSSKLLIELDYFEHDRSTGIGFFNVDSYSIDPNESTSNTTAIATPQIPTFSSRVSDDVFDLRDSIDFRPRLASTSADATTVGSATVNPTDTASLDIDSDGSYVPVPDLTWTSDAIYYLGRIDRVVIGKNGIKRVVKGVPSSNPIPPQQPAESMSLALLSIPPFPSLSQENSRRFNQTRIAVKVKPIFNKRYTMKDIAALDQRIGNLEYYTALNLLEKSASDLQIPDDNGINRFKNGIFVESFFSHAFADNTNVAYAAAIDKKKGEVRPKFEQFNIDLALDTTANVTRKGKHVRLEVSSASAYTAGTSISAAPSGASGTVRDAVLVSGNPAGGTAVYRLYVHNSSGTFAVSDTITGGGGGSVTTVENATTSDALTMNYTHSTYVTQPWASNLVNPVTELMFDWRGELTLTPEADHWKDVTTFPEYTFELDLASPFEAIADAIGTTWGDWSQSVTTETETTTEFFNSWTKADDVRRFRRDTITTDTITTDIREGVRVNVDPFTQTQSTGPFVTDVGTVPYIREQVISFSATGMRPDTRVFPFFEDTSVTAYVTPTGGSLGGELTTDSEGKVSGTFLIPNNDALKFRVGERRFKLVDIQDLIVEAGNITTSASAPFNASGLTVSQRGLSLTTREPNVITEPLTEVITNVETTTEVLINGRPPQDPISQTFVVGEFEYTDPGSVGGASGVDKNFGIGADGIFVTALDLYFEKKPSGTNGIAVELREVINGQITNIRVPGGYKRLEVPAINTSSDGQAVTPFYFDSPVYLRGGKEYAFVVRPDGNDPDYRVWTARLGGTDVNSGALIDQQPAVGMLFTSANDRTYSPRQNEDIKFTIWRAAFSTGVTGSATLVNQSDEYLKVTQVGGGGRFTVGESVVGEKIIQLSSNTKNVGVGDTVYFGSNTGIIRKIIDSTNTQVKFSADIAGIPTSTINFIRSGGTGYTGVVSSQTANTIAGTVQFYNPGTGELVIDSSVGGYVANTSDTNGFVRGLTSNTAAQVYFVRDYKYNLISPRLSIAQYVDTNFNVSVKTTSNAYAIDSTFTPIRPDADYTFYDAEKLVAGKTSETNNTSGNKTLTIRTTMSTNNERLSPVFDLGRAKSLVLVKNIVNNTANNEFGNFGLANCKYITKKIALADGQDAEDIRVILDAYRPAGTDVQVYARFSNAYDGEDFADKHYTKLVAATTQKRDSSVTDVDDFVEVEYNMPTSRDSTTIYSAFANTNNGNIMEYKTLTGDIRHTTYKYVSLKIVMTSTGSHLVPRVRALRAIALQR